MDAIDQAAFELAIEIARRDPVQRLRIDKRFADGVSFEQVGRSAAYGCQNRALKLMPWQLPPCSAGDKSMLNEPFGDASGRRESAELLRQMQRLGISAWHPDPLAAIAEREAAVRAHNAKERSVRLS